MQKQSSVYDRGAVRETANFTVRKYPRTLDEAFRSGAEYGCAITVYRNPMRKVTYWASMVASVTIVYGLLAWAAK
jgi:hypothetical protein